MIKKEIPKDVYMLRLFLTSINTNINLNKEEVENIISYITELEKYYTYYIELTNELEEIVEDKENE